MQIEELHRIYLQQNQKINTDTRKIEKGAIFFALKGESFDANTFAIQAIEKGCSYAVVDDVSVKYPKCIVVNNVLKTLQELANFHRRQFSIPILGITGTNGKTTTKELINEVLSTQYKVHCTKGNLNNHIGVPLTLLSMPKSTEFAVIEMGANHVGEIKFLCSICEPNYTLVTNMGKAHLEGFGGYEGVIKTKSEMYDFTVEKSGKCFVNASDDLLIRQSANVKKRLFYQDQNLHGKVISSSPLVSAEITIDGENIKVQSKLFGEHNLINMLAAAAVGKEFGVSVSNIKNALEGYQPENNRSQIKKSFKGNTLILDAYNANPSSMSMALLAFAKITDKSKLAILGEMRELGESANFEHKKIIQLLKDNNVNAILVGSEFCKCNSSFQCFQNSMELKSFLENESVSNTSILIKGSRGIKLEIVEEVL